MKKYSYAGGRIILSSKIVVPINDLAVLRGYAVFDFLKTVHGKPFLWQEHWRRFLNSAAALGLKVPVNERGVKKIIFELLKKNKTSDASIRLLLTGGASVDGLSLGKPNFFILMEDLHQFPERCFTRGAKLITQEYERVLPEAKTTSYIIAVRLQGAKKKAGASEILFTSRGRVLECSTSNFFIVKKGKVITAPEGILFGTIRNKVIELAREAGIVVEERELKTSELKTADEAFLTATSKDVMPIVQIDQMKIADGKIGPVTKKLMQLFAEFVARH